MSGTAAASDAGDALFDAESTTQVVTPGLLHGRSTALAKTIQTPVTIDWVPNVFLCNVANTGIDFDTTVG